MEPSAVAWARAPRRYPLAHAVSTALGSATLTTLLLHTHATEPRTERSIWRSETARERDRLRRHPHECPAAPTSSARQGIGRRPPVRLRDSHRVRRRGCHIVHRRSDSPQPPGLSDRAPSRRSRPHTASRRLPAVSEDGTAELRHRRDQVLTASLQGVSRAGFSRASRSVRRYQSGSAAGATKRSISPSGRATNRTTFRAGGVPSTAADSS